MQVATGAEDKEEEVATEDPVVEHKNEQDDEDVWEVEDSSSLTHSGHHATEGEAHSQSVSVHGLRALPSQRAAMHIPHWSANLCKALGGRQVQTNRAMVAYGVGHGHPKERLASPIQASRLHRYPFCSA